MLDLYYWTTPNGHKITLLLEETQLEYKIVPINIGEGDQFTPEFLKISPNNRIPALVDHSPAQTNGPISVFESGAILMYLAEKTGQFLPTADKARYEVIQWLFWQMGGLGPMLGQNHHFNQYAPEKIPYAIDRYERETTRLYSVLNQQLKGRQFIAGEEYSIADMASYPWIVHYDLQNQNLNDYPALKSWFERIAERPATQKAYEKANEINANPPSSLSEKARDILFGGGPA